MKKKKRGGNYRSHTWEFLLGIIISNEFKDLVLLPPSVLMDYYAVRKEAMWTAESAIFYVQDQQKIWFFIPRVSEKAVGLSLFIIIDIKHSFFSLPFNPLVLERWKKILHKKIKTDEGEIRMNMSREMKTTDSHETRFALFCSQSFPIAWVCAC